MSGPTSELSSAQPQGAALTPLLSYAECSARERLAHLVDAGSFHEWLPPSERLTSPHLAQLGVPSAFDDGVAIGRALLGGRPVFVAAQEGAFMRPCPASTLGSDRRPASRAAPSPASVRNRANALDAVTEKNS